MSSTKPILTDTFGRHHSYLRISLTERCNIRCSYCMPQEGVPITPSEQLMDVEEIFTLASLFVKHGVTKIRLTGGEPLMRKDFPEIIEKLASLPVTLSITTNAVIVDRYIRLLQQHRVHTINISLDTFKVKRFHEITFRNYFQRVYDNILLLIKAGFKVKINAVLIKGLNEDEIIDFIQFTKDHPVSFRFIEFMPFDGNQWKRDKTVSYQDIMDKVNQHYAASDIIRLTDAPNDTAKNFQIKGYVGQFAMISTVTNPFCDQCNRLRLTANGQLKNCLFSSEESDLLTALRNHSNIEPIIEKAVNGKHRIRAGMETTKLFEDPKQHEHNRSMITIGG